ncbi:hypothetical protein G6F22_016133 [Rhizopus arrhizus]|nr:hypothetical protein G6F22_016133 [Rhizopus arrhizus]
MGHRLTLPRGAISAQLLVVDIAAPVAQHVVEIVQLARPARGLHVDGRQQHFFLVAAGGARGRPALRSHDQAAAHERLAAFGAHAVGAHHGQAVAVRAPDGQRMRHHRPV